MTVGQDLDAVLAELATVQNSQQSSITDLIERVNAAEAAILDHGHGQIPPPLPPPDQVGILMVSTSPARTNPRPLRDVGQISNKVYIWYKPAEDVTNVRFFLNGSLYRQENIAPYDFGGSVGISSGPFDTAGFPNEDITIRATGTQVDGGTETVSVTVAVFNTAAIPPPDQGLLVPFDATGSWFDQFPGPNRIFQYRGRYEALTNIAPRDTDKHLGDVIVGDAPQFSPSKNGTPVYKQEKKSGTTLLVSPGGTTPLFRSATNVEISGMEVIGFIAPGIQKGVIGDGNGHARSRISHMIVTDAKAGNAFRIGNGGHYERIIATGAYNLGWGGVMGKDFYLGHSMFVKNGLHNSGTWEIGNKGVIGSGLIEFVYAEANAMAGIWLDIDVDQIIVRYNWVKDNGAVGIKHELSGAADIYQNIVEGNGRGDIPGNVPLTWGWDAGIQIQNSGSVGGVSKPIQVRDNLVTFGAYQGNSQNGIAIIEQNRFNRGKQYHSDNILVTGNVVTRTNGNGRHIGRWVDNGYKADNISITANDRIGA